MSRANLKKLFDGFVSEKAAKIACYILKKIGFLENDQDKIGCLLNSFVRSKR